MTDDGPRRARGRRGVDGRDAIADVLGDARDRDALVAALRDLDDALAAYCTRRLAARLRA